MWDRLRSAAGGGGGTGSPEGRESRGRSSSAFSPPPPSSAPSTTTGNNHNNNWTNSWQPRSSVFAAARQPDGRFAGKTGPPPPRPPREFEATAAAEDPSEHEHYHYQHRPPAPGRSQTLPAPPPPPPPQSYLNIPNHHNVRDSAHWRPASSIYSQPSPLHADFGGGVGKTYGVEPGGAGVPPPSRYTIASSPGEVSPPSSPEVFANYSAPNHDISPIDEEEYYSTPPQAARPITKMPLDHAVPPSQKRAATDPPVEEPDAPTTARTSIPLMRRERRQQKEAEAAAARREPPQIDQRTRPSQTKPPGFARGLGISTMSSTTPGSPPGPGRGGGGGGGAGRSIPGGGRAGPAGRPTSSRRQTGQPHQPPTGGHTTDPAVSAFTSSRPGWKGASGRTAIVDPVRDNPEVEPLKIPPRSAKRNSPRPVEEAGSPSEQQRLHAGGAGAGRGGLARGGDDGMTSPPTSPDTMPPPSTTAGQQAIGGGGGSAAGNMPTPTQSNVTSSLASTLRKIMPSSSSESSSSSSGPRQSRMFSGGSLLGGGLGHGHGNGLGPNSKGQQQQGYPSPPLSDTTPTDNNAHSANHTGSDTGLAPAINALQGQSHASPANGNANATNTNATNAGARGQNHAQAQARGTPTANLGPNVHALPTQQPTPSTRTLATTTTTFPPASVSQHQQDAIRRKEIGSGRAQNTSTNTDTDPTTPRQHRPHDSFSSSVYSIPDDDVANNNNGPPPPIPSLPAQYQPPQSARQPSQPRLPINTNNLPSLPGAREHADSDSPYAQPPSRFSITTYATSARTASPRTSFDQQTAPPLPTPPNDMVIGFRKKSPKLEQAPASVLERRRPEMRGGENKWEEPKPEDAEPVKISLSKAWMSTAGANSAGINTQGSPPRSRKPVSKGARDLHPAKKDDREANKENKENNNNNNNNNSSNSTSRGFGFGFLSPRSSSTPGSDSNSTSRPPSVTSNMDKDLPLAPSVAASTAPTTTDRIAHLNAQLQDLANRRININRAIKQMTELMPKDNLIMPDEVRRKREGEKRKIEELRNKLSDIQGEEHDLGMKLHRAYKKLDKQAEYEPTTLWVRRATGT